MRSVYFFAALPVLASASSWTPGTLFSRAANVTCGSGDKVCGAWCIPSDYTCCPDEEGGCSATSVCQQGDNKEYGCCPIGEMCNGDGGAEFGNSTSTSTSTSTSSSSATGTRSSSTSSATLASSTNGAQPLVLSQGLSIAVAAAGIAALL